MRFQPVRIYLQSGWRHAGIGPMQNWGKMLYTFNIQNIPTDNGNKRQYSCLCQHLKDKKAVSKLTSNWIHFNTTSRSSSDFSLFNVVATGAQSYFEAVHDLTGLDWWATIVLAVIPLRLVVFGVVQYVIQKEAATHKEMNTRVLPEKEKKLIQWAASEEGRKTLIKLNIRTDEEKRAYFKQEMKKFAKECYQQYNCHPFRPMVISFLPLPMWITFSTVLSAMCGRARFGYNVGIVPTTATGGCLWFPDLTVCDHYHILPIIASFSFLLSLEFNILTRPSAVDTRSPLGQLNIHYLSIQSFIENIIRVLSLTFIYFGWNAEAGMTYYWCVSGVFVLAVRLAMIHPKIVSHFPQTRKNLENTNVNFLEHPYKQLWIEFKKKYIFW